MPTKNNGWSQDYTWMAVTIGGGLGAVLMAWRNLRLGRGDRQGAIRLARFAFAGSLLVFLLRAHFVPTSWSFSLFVEAVGQALWIGGMLWLAYIALEPVVRRLWPRSLISWMRLLSGRWQDPLVARDVLIGLLVGLGYDLMFAASHAIQMRMGEKPGTAAKLDNLLGISHALSNVVDRILVGLDASLLFFLLFFLLRVLLRKEWLAGAGFVVLFLIPRAFSADYPQVELPAMAIVYAVIVFMLVRSGLLALVVTIFVTDLVGELVFTTNFSAWYGAGSLLFVVVVAGIAIFAFRKSLGGHRISAALLDQ
jgi:serine/threonine-protein kinase